MNIDELENAVDDLLGKLSGECNEYKSINQKHVEIEKSVYKAREPFEKNSQKLRHLLHIYINRKLGKLYSFCEVRERTYSINHIEYIVYPVIHAMFMTKAGWELKRSFQPKNIDNIKKFISETRFLLESVKKISDMRDL